MKASFGWTLSLSIAMSLAMSGCLQITGVGDYKAGGSSTSGGTCTNSTSFTCSSANQCGCAANQTCSVIGADGATACLPAGSLGYHSLCSGVNQCAPGLECVAGTCTPYCDPAVGCSTGTDRCLQVCATKPDGSCTPQPGQLFCMTTCNLVDPNSCGAGLSCSVAGADGTICIAAGAGAAGTTCTRTTDCNAGLGCFTATGMCQQWCLVDSGECSPGKACKSIGTLNGTNYGACDL